MERAKENLKQAVLWDAEQDLAQLILAEGLDEHLGDLGRLHAF